MYTHCMVTYTHIYIYAYTYRCIYTYIHMHKSMRLVDFEGEHTAKVDGTTVEGWIQRAEEIGFFTLEKEYDNPNVTDLPEKETTITVGEKSHTIRSRYGVPDALRAWEKGLMQYVLKEIEWTKTAE